MKKILLAMALALLGVQAAHANGELRYNTEGKVLIRFWFDEVFVGSAQRSNLITMQKDLLAAMQDVGKHSLGMKFESADLNTIYTVRLPPPRGVRFAQSESLTNFMRVRAPRDGVVDVLIHNYGNTPTGTCDYDIVPGGTGSTENTWGWSLPRAPVNGAAGGSIAITAKASCSASSTQLRSFGAILDTFAHELGHVLQLPDFGSTYASCKTRPSASVMCQTTASGIRRSYKTWFLADVRIVRTAFFGANRRNPVLACYEWSSYQACDTNCVNGAGFPNPGATELYNACRVQQCNNICSN